MTKKSQLMEAGAVTVDEVGFIGTFAGGSAVLSTTTGALAYMRFNGKGTFVGTIRNNRPIGGKWFFRNGQLCFQGFSKDRANCHLVYAWPNGTHFLVEPDTGHIVYRFKRIFRGATTKSGERPSF